MTFTVTYRGRDGAKHEETIEAANRAECVAEYKQRDITPMGIREGRSGKKATSPKNSNQGGGSSSQRYILGKAAILATVILIVLGGTWWWWATRAPNQESQRADKQKSVHSVQNIVASKRIPPAQKPTKPKQVPSVVTNESVAKADPLPPWNDSFITNREMRIKFSVLASAQTNDSGVVTERYRLPNGKFWRRQIDPPPLFENISDNAIAMVLGDRSGAPIPPVPGLDEANLDEAFIQSLSVPVEIKDTDTPGIVALKMAVMEAREEIKLALKSSPGRRVGEILQEHIELTNHQADMTAKALTMLEKVRQRDGDEAAAEYAERVNEKLKSFGMSPIKMTTVNRRRQ